MPKQTLKQYIEAYQANDNAAVRTQVFAALARKHIELENKLWDLQILLRNYRAAHRAEQSLTPAEVEQLITGAPKK
jgi:hypothetical protein